MTATFDSSLATAKDRIRQRIGDTDEADAQIQDETIAAYLAQGLSELAVSYQLCLDLEAKWAAAGDVMIDDQRQLASKVAERYMLLAKRFKLEMTRATAAGQAYAGVLVGGLTDSRTAIQDQPASAYPSPPSTIY